MRRTPFLTMLLVLATAALGASDPFQNKGFSPDKVFSVGDIDSVNVFNGNLIVRVPIGQVYSVGPLLQYQLVLTYNGKIWDYVMEEPIPPTVGHPALSPIRTARPEERSNAGLGWTLSLGRLIPAQAIEPLHGWIYVGADGSEHEIVDATDPAVAVSKDGSYLRMRREPSNTAQPAVYREIDFPDGTIQRFDLDGNLTESRDRFGNWVRVTYEPYKWIITDGFGASLGRTHEVWFTPSPHSIPNFSKPVSQVRLAAANNTTAVYSFNYSIDAQIGRGGDGERAYNSPSKCLNVPLLTSVTLPDGSAYVAEYHMPEGSDCTISDPLTDGSQARVESGFIKSLTLPTNGKIVWTAGRWWSNLQHCRPYYISDPNVPPPPDYSNGYKVAYVGVTSRTLYDIGQTPANTPDAPVWTYKTAYVDLNESSYGKCHQSDLRSRWFAKPAEELINVLEAPNGLVTKHFFSVYPLENGGTTVRGFKADEHGLPLTHNDVAPGTSDRYLSTEVFDCSVNPCSPRVHNAPTITPLRRKYVTYDYETELLYPARNARVTGERTLYPDDTGCTDCYTDTSRTLWNGCGNFKRSVVTSTIPGSVTTTNHVEYVDQPCADINSSDWLLNLYSSSWTKAGESGTKSVTTFVGGKGVVESVRTLRGVSSDPAGIAESPSDLMVVSCRDSAKSAGQRGFVTSERFVGGDGAGIPSGAPASICTAARGIGHYFLEHDYRFSANTSGYLTGHRSYWSGVPSLTTDADVDRNTGLVVATADASGVALGYDYDWAGRLTGIVSPDRVSTNYAYASAASLGAAAVNVTRTHPYGSANSTELLPSETYHYDGFGRPVKEVLTMPPSGATSLRMTDYDPATGQKSAVSELGRITAQRPVLPKTNFGYDVLGRPTVVTAPDTGQTTFTYWGDRVKRRSFKVATSPSALDTEVLVYEHYDGLGRLVKVVEPSGGLGQAVETHYSYDSGGRLATVRMIGAEGHIQNRVFDYDGAGLLRWESHPESGMASYTYDARGHVLSRNQSSAASPYDLRYTYDGAERLLLLEGRNPSYSPPATADQPEFRPIKKYQYAEQNDPGNASVPINRIQGKLWLATRYNYPPTETLAPYLADIYTVDDWYEYRAPGGMISLHGRGISKTPALSVTPEYIKDGETWYEYTDLGSIAKISYPVCMGCGVPDGGRRVVQQTYSYGRLATVPGFVNSAIGYSENGMRHTLQHANGIVDTQEIDSTTLMTRPMSLTSATYNSCTAPVFAQQPVGGQKNGSTPVPLTVTLTGSQPFTYQWYADGVPIDGNVEPSAWQATYYAAPQQTTDYYVEVKNSCRPDEGIYSDTATVSVNTCEAPWVTAQQPKPLPDGTWQLEAFAGGADPLTVKWYRKSDNTLMGTGKVVTLGPLTSTTIFTVKVTHPCSTNVATQDVTVTIPLPMTTSGFSATVHPSFANRIVLSWPTSAGAAKYQVQRRSKLDLGGGWVNLGLPTTSTTYTDEGLTLEATYAYRVYAVDSGGGSISGYSNADAVTLHTFSPVVTGTVVTPTVINDILAGVNSVREAAGWAQVTWSNIVATGEGLPVPGATIRAAHVMACRARLNEALQALGAPISGYSDPNLFQATLRALHFTELQVRMK